MEKEKIEKLALTVATLVVDASQRVVSSWTNELKVLKNINIHGPAFASLLLEAVIFGHYYVGEKFKGYMNKEEAKVFSDELNEKMIFMLAMMLESEQKEKDGKAHENKIGELYIKFAPEKHQALANYKGNTILDLFKEDLRQVFNDNDFKVKFLENTFKNRIKLNIANALSGGNPNNKYKDDTFLDNKVIYAVSDALFAEFSSVNYEQLSRDADELL